MKEQIKPDRIYGATYHLWRNNEYLGIGTWTEDENIGDSFQIECVDEKGRLNTEVFIADYWTLAKI